MYVFVKYFIWAFPSRVDKAVASLNIDYSANPLHLGFSSDLLGHQSGEELQPQYTLVSFSYIWFSQVIFFFWQQFRKKLLGKLFSYKKFKDFQNAK